MIFTEEFRKKLKLAKNFCLPLAVRFQTGKVYLVGLESSVLLQVDHDLFGPIEIPGEMHFEGDSVGTIIEMIACGANFEFDAGQAVATSGNVRTVFRPVPGPEFRVPIYLLTSEEEDQTWSTTLYSDLVDFVSGIEFAFTGIRKSKASMFSNRIFMSKIKNKLIIFGTDNTVINMAYCGVGTEHTEGRATEFIFPAKQLHKAAKIMSEELTGIHLQCYADCAILSCKSSGIDLYFPLLMGTVPDYHEIVEKIKECDCSVRVEDVTKLLPPKEMLKIGDIAEISVSKTNGINIAVLHTGASSLFNTDLQVTEEIEDVCFKVKKDEFFRCLSTLNSRILIRWVSDTPLFVAIQAEGKISVHALELGEWQ